MIAPEPPDVAGWSWWTGPDGDYIDAECYLCRQFELIYQAGRTETATQADAQRWLDAHQCPPETPRTVVKVAHVMPVTPMLLEWSNDYRAALDTARTALLEQLRKRPR